MNASRERKLPGRKRPRGHCGSGTLSENSLRRDKKKTPINSEKLRSPGEENGGAPWKGDPTERARRAIVLRVPTSPEVEFEDAAKGREEKKAGE